MEVKDLCKAYGDKVLMKDFTYIFLKNDRVGIIGPNGSGKSTLGRVICGLLKPDRGEVRIHGTSVYASRSGRKNLQKRLSVVFQDYTTSANPRSG